jgi:hypothetical protein
MRVARPDPSGVHTTAYPTGERFGPATGALALAKRASHASPSACHPSRTAARRAPRAATARDIELLRHLAGSLSAARIAAAMSITEVFSADWWPAGFSVLKSAGQQPVGRVAA